MKKEIGGGENKLRIKRIERKLRWMIVEDKKRVLKIEKESEKERKEGIVDIGEGRDIEKWIIGRRSIGNKWIYFYVR